MSAVPKRSRGYQSEAARARYGTEVEEFCATILETRSGLEFSPSARGWCYVLEEHGLTKGDFDSAEKLINDCRKSGLLPLDICGEDDKRSFENVGYVDQQTPEQKAASIIEEVSWEPDFYWPFSFWEDLDFYLQMLVEKIDIRRLFEGECREFSVPIANAGGWNDLNCRGELMERFKEWEAKGKQCVLLYLGDFDPGGLNISGCMRANLADLSRATGWSPNDLIIDRFGLDYEFIQAEGLTWIDNLITGTGKDLADPKHPDHAKLYVQSYLRRYGARKVESNALLAPSRVAKAKELCRKAILKYVPPDAPQRWRKALEEPRAQVRTEMLRLRHERFGDKED